MLSLTALACAAEPGVSQRTIYGGSPDSGDPAVVAVLSSTSLCTGTLISARVVLTAAHCVDVTPEVVVFGSRVDAYTDVKRVIEAQAHPGWDESTLANDFALLLLEAPSSVTPRPLNRTAIDDSLLDEPVRLVGFGNDDNENAGVKLQLTDALDDYDDQHIEFGNWWVGIAPGDSGGPEFMTIGGIEVVAGVASYYNLVTGNGYGGRVDLVAASFIDPWIAAREAPAPSGGFGDFCVGDADCESQVCVEDGLFCSTTCTVDTDCATGMSCLDIFGRMVCSYPWEPAAPEPCTANGRSGVCIDTSECTSGHMSVPGYCPGPVNIQCCVATSAPPPNPDPPPTPPPLPPPEPLPDKPEDSVASDELSGGCAVGAGTRGSALPVVALLLLGISLTARRRRGPSRPPRSPRLP